MKVKVNVRHLFNHLNSKGFDQRPDFAFLQFKIPRKRDNHILKCIKRNNKVYTKGLHYIIHTLQYHTLS